MNLSDLKRYLFLPGIYLLSFIFIFSSIAQAADIQAQLDSNNGSSGFTIENSSNVGVDRTDSNGNVGIGTTTALTLLYVSPQGFPPTYVGSGDAYIQNNLEVDGTAYLNDVEINGLEVTPDPDRGQVHRPAAGLRQGTWNKARGARRWRTCAVAALQNGILNDAGERAQSQLKILLYQLGFTQIDLRSK